MSLQVLSFLHTSATNIWKHYDIKIKSLFLPQIYCNRVLYDNQIVRHLRTSPFLQKTLKGTYTIEAAVCMPVFICLVVFILYLFLIMQKQWEQQCMMYGVVEEAAIHNHNEEAEESNLVLGALQGFALGKLDFSKSEITKKDFDVIAMYQMPIPIRLFGDASWSVCQRVKARKWNGYDPHESEDLSKGVYVTETGSAYHQNNRCVYLNPSIKSIGAQSVGTARSKGGDKYKACERCRPTMNGNLYITDYGNVYHKTLSCSSLKRTVKRVSMQEAMHGGFHACGKCGI